MKQRPDRAGRGLRALAGLAGPLVAAAAFGCAGAPPPSSFPTPRAALDRMKATFACANGVQGTAKIDHFSKEGRVRGEMELFAVNPDRVRFDVVSPFGVTLYTLTSDGAKFEMADLQKKEFLHGPASACNLARLTQVPVPGHALVALLRGEAPVLVHEPGDASMVWRDGAYRITVRGKHQAEEAIALGVHPSDWDKPWAEQRLRVLDVLVRQAGVDLYHAELKNHEAFKTAPARVDEAGIDDPIPPSGGACEAEAPASIRLRVPNSERDVIFQYKKAAWNPPLVPGAFTQPVPGGVRKIYVDCAK